MDYEAFKHEIYRMTGINLSAYKEKQMKRRIDSLINKNNFNGYSDYVKELKVNNTIYNEFINYLTINVSEFYRNAEQWQVLQKEIIPELLNRTRRLKVWSCACSTGDEPYTLAMVLNNFVSLKEINILATDIDEGAIAKARTGIYSSKSLESLPKSYIEKYFVKERDFYRINEDIKKCVEFKKLNLLRDKYPEENDLIVCRNVLIYFTEEAKDELYKKFNQSLKKNGVLFVGSTEQIINSKKYNLRPIRMFFYIKEGMI
jgi:chemotaxis protein methyltransferase CheR